MTHVNWNKLASEVCKDMVGGGWVPQHMAGQLHDRLRQTVERYRKSEGHGSVRIVELSNAEKKDNSE